MLGPARMHHTIVTGEVISKAQAGEYALRTFDAEWHPIIHEALAHHRARPASPAFKDKTHRYRTTGQFGLHVIHSANSL